MAARSRLPKPWMRKSFWRRHWTPKVSTSVGRTSARRWTTRFYSVSTFGFLIFASIGAVSTTTACRRSEPMATVTLTTEDSGAIDGVIDFIPATKAVFVIGWDEDRALSANSLLYPNVVERTGLKLPVTGLVRSTAGSLLAPPRIETATLTLASSTATTAASSLRVRVYTGPSLAAFSNTNIPGDGPRWVDAVQLPKTLDTVGATGAQRNRLFNVPVLAIDDLIVVPLDTGVLNSVAGHKDWEGVFSISIEGPEDIAAQGRALSFYENAHASGAAPSLVYTTGEFHTGHNTRPGVRTRAVHDMKTGFPVESVELVEDGFTEGVWTLPKHRDLDDPFEEDAYVSDPEEGGHDGIPTR